MPDYNLAGLSPQSFEQLIQAIALKVIGPGLVIFGAGPDGAREGTFEGRMQYPSLAEPWDGYLVVQAKFLQRPLGTSKDGQWLLKHLESELSKFSKGRVRRLRRPNYYLLCTNVVLSSVHLAGAKDRIDELFVRYAPQLGLKGYAVWDYDKLRSFIDDSADIRMAYLAWTTPGDVLRRAMEWFEGTEPDFHQVITSFLESDLLDDRYARLDQAGHAAKELTPMANLFIDLPVSDKPTIDPPDESKDPTLLPGFLRELLDAGAQKLDPASLAVVRHATGKRIRRKQELPYGRYVLIGGPGQGKTTVGQFACQLYRASILSERPNLLPEVRDAISGIQQHCNLEKIDLPTGRRFPIRVVLNDFATALAGGTVTSLVEYIAKIIRERSHGKLSVEVLHKWLKIYPWFLVLDGLDEVPASSNRDAVVRSVTHFLGFANNSGADLLVLATTRPQGYNADFSPEYYTHRYLTPLSVRRALLYGERLANLTHGQDSTIATEVKQNLRSAVETATTARLMRSPLQITIMATLVARGGPAPQERWLLFRKYYNVIYDRETAKRIGEVTTILRSYRNHIDAIHYRVGLILQIESERTGQTDARLGIGDLSRIVRDRLEHEGLQGGAAAELERGIIHAASDRLVFLVGVREGQVGFEIRSLQEFMASEALMDGSDESIIKRLNHLAPIVHWSNVFLFAAGKCFSDRQHLRHTISDICSTMNEQNPDGGVNHLTLAGSQLSVTLLLDGIARQQWNFEQTLARIACRLTDRPGCELHDRLASSYHDEIQRIYGEELKRTSMTDSGRWGVLLPLANRGINWAQVQAEEELPKILASPYGIEMFFARPIEPWCASRLERALAIVGPAGAERLLMRRTSELDSSFTGEFKHLIQILRSLSRRPERTCTLLVAVTPTNSATISFQITPLDEWEGTTIPKNLVLSPPWRALADCVNFGHRPSAISLAAALRAISQAPESLETTRLLTRLSFPWPLMSCVASCSNSNDLAQLAERARRGDLGDVDQWRIAEKRWRDRGVSIEDLIAYDRKNCEIGSYMVDVGFPALAAAWGSSETTWAPDCLELWCAIREPKLRARIAQVALAHEFSAMLSPDDASAMMLDIAVTYQWCDLSWIRRFKPSELARPRVIESLDAIGRTARYFVWDASDEAPSDSGFDALRTVYMRNSGYDGLLPILAHFRPLGAEAGAIIQLFPPFETSSAAIQNAMLILEITGTHPSAKRLDILMQRASSLLLGQEPYLGVDFLERLRHSMHLNSDLHSIAIWAYNHSSDEQVRATAVGVLDDIERRKRSTLDDPSVRDALGLSYIFRVDAAAASKLRT